MIEDKPTDYEVEYNKVSNELVELKQKYSELEQDWKYIKSLLDTEFEKGIELKKENEQLYKLLYSANTLFAFETSESCQAKWKKRLEELKSE